MENRLVVGLLLSLLLASTSGCRELPEGRVEAAYHLALTADTLWGDSQAPPLRALRTSISRTVFGPTWLHAHGVHVRVQH